MSFQVQPGRLDQLLLAVLGHCVQTYVEPHANFPLWESGLGKLIETGIQRVVPQAPVTSVTIGNMQIPIEVFHGLARAAKLLPEANRAGA